MKKLVLFAASGLLGTLIAASWLDPEREAGVSPQAAGLPAGFEEGLPPPPPSPPPQLREYAAAGESIVLSEVQYHPESDDPRDEWIELYNRSTRPRDVGGWRLSEAVEFTFPDGTTMEPGGHLVAGADAERLRSAFGIENVVGNWTGTLKDGTETIRLLARDGKEVLAFRYQDRLPFPTLADGGGRSLELRNPHGDVASPANWGAATPSGWQRFQVDGTATSSRLYIYLLGAGTAYVDDVSLQILPRKAPAGAAALFGEVSAGPATPTPPPAAAPAREAVGNGFFEDGVRPWRFEGNHSRSRITSETARSGRRCLKVVATGAGSTRTTAVTQDVSTISGESYRLEFWALLPTPAPLVARLSGSREGTNGIFIETRPAGMTPGRANSLFTSRTPPFIHPVACSPAAPGPGEPATITATITAPAPVKEATLVLDAGEGPIVMPLRVDEAAGSAGAPGVSVYSARVGPFAPGTLVRYHITCIDAAGARGRYPPADSPALALGFFAGRPPSSDLPVYRLFVSPAVLADLDQNPSSDAYRKGDLVADGKVYCDIGIRYRGHTSRYYPKHHWKLKFHRHDPFVLPGSAGLHAAGTINLNSSYADKSFLREILGYRLFRDLDEPYCESRHVILDVNGAISGLYLQVENPGEEYLERHGLQSGWLWKSYANALGSTTRFELKAGDPEAGAPLLEEFIAAVNALAGRELEDFLAARLDAASFIDYLVACQLIHNTDHVEKNYFLYASPEGKFRVFPWDLDLTHGRNFECSGGGLLHDDLRHDMWDPEFNDEELLFGTREHPKCEGRPNGIIDAFLGRTAKFRPAYYARLAECLARYYHPEVLIPKIERLYDSIRAEARRDREAWATYGGSPGVDRHVKELESWVSRRFAHLKRKLERLGYPVGEPLNADFEPGAAAGEAPLTVTFANFSAGKIERYEWDFGDGTKSAESKPLHVFKEPGCYTVSLLAAGPAGEHRAVRRDAIHVLGAMSGAAALPARGIK